MLDLDTVQGAHRMPVDFATYLLSPSPPASNLDLLNYAFSPEAQLKWQSTTDSGHINNEDEIYNTRNFDDFHDNNVAFADIFKPPIGRNERLKSGKKIKPIIIKKYENPNFCESSEYSSTANSGPGTHTSSCSPPGRNKRVSFADNKGLALVTVKIMTEASDQPPCLDPEILRSIINDAETEVEALPTYKLNCTQPASDYLAFREKIEKHSVSLENLIIKDNHVIGTVKVKNICFDKRVFIRCTFDDWKSSQDIESKYVQPLGNKSVQNFDTFSFEFDIDSKTARCQTIQFAVAYETPSGQFWDNNDGCNYHIIAIDANDRNAQQTPNPLPTSTQPTLKKVDSWTEYGCWHHVDTQCPYY